MKTIEEKAKAYDKAREKIAVRFGINVAEEIFSEFEESEDEKIRKALIEMVHDTTGDTLWVDYNVHKEDAIAWLQKQGSEPNWCHHKVDLSDCSEEYRKAYYDGWNNCNQQHSQCNAEQKSAEWKQENVEELSEFENAMMHIGYSFFGKRGGLDPNDTSSVKVQAQYLLELAQKPAWSEEDINKPNGGIVMEDFNDGNGFYKVNLAYLNKKQVEQIEELVKRWDLQPKVNEDESIISDLLDYFDEDKCLKHEVNDIVKWLKTIKPQQQVWSENEIKMLDNLITYLDGRKDLLEEIKSTYIDWLKSLRPHNNWKPSDEQMKQLGWIAEQNKDNMIGKELISLYQDLKKLREE